MTTPVELVARYRGYAAQCWDLAQAQDNVGDRLILLDMAQTWIAFADCVEKSESLFAPVQ